MLDGRVLEIRVNGDSQIGRKRPGRRRPDEEKDFPTTERSIYQRRVAGERELDVNGRASMLMIFDLCFGERCLIVYAPVDGTRALVDVAALDETTEEARRLCLVSIRHCQIRI